MNHLIVNLGLFMAGAAILSVILRYARQSSIIAFIAVGIIAGFYREQVDIPHELIEVFTEVGIILLLFMAGLEIEFESFLNRWKLVLANGLGQIFITLIIGTMLGWVLLDIEGLTALIYFGLCLTFSSTIVVISYLKSKKEMESFHGQLTLGLMVLQDVIAVTALVIIASLSGEGSILASIGLIVLKMVVLASGLYLLARFALKHVFRFLAETKELVFVGSLGWALGIAALCELFHFSPEIGAFMAGASISFLPYRLEIQDKVEPMKDFGVILFFIALGYSLEIDRSTLSLVLPLSIVSAFVLFGTPVIMLFIGYLLRIKSRPSFMIGATINQISEFSLILATLCVQAGIFNDQIFLLVTMATMMTIFFSSLGQQFMESVYNLFRTPLAFIDNHSELIYETDLDGFELADHVVVIKYNELAERFLNYFLSINKRVLLIDIDPEVFDLLSGKHENLRCMYADIFDADTREDAKFQDSTAIISCMVEGQEAELGILNWMRDEDLNIPFIASTDSRLEALELYRAGATFVIQTEDLAAERIEELLKEHGVTMEGLSGKGKLHHDSLHKASGDVLFRFT